MKPKLTTRSARPRTCSDLTYRGSARNGLRLEWLVPTIGCLLIAAVSVWALPWPSAVASIILGILMMIGAEVDAKTFMLPDAVTLGATLAGVAAACALAPNEPWHAVEIATVRSLGTATTLALIRWFYGYLRGHEGLGLGDVKLAAAIGAWLSVEDIPLTFALAAVAALVTVLVAHLRGRAVDRLTRVPFGAYLCPALWLIYFGRAVVG
jgi:leader peptidase (prepilin peptidase) / N-methyltransferase